MPRNLLGDEVRLRQIVTNLVGNAIKFTDTGGVLVTVGRLADTARPLTGDEVAVAITVEDSGIGIAPDALPFLFHEFEQAEAAVRRRLGGTGLGLAISRRLAQAMAGDIFVASEPGKGSTFTAVARLRRAGAQAPAAPLAMPASGRHVLLALDRPIERRALGLALEGAGVPVEDGTVAGAGDLIDAAARAGEPFTTILVDGSLDREAAAKLLVRAREAAPGRSGASRRCAGHVGQGRISGAAERGVRRLSRSPGAPAILARLHRGRFCREPRARSRRRAARAASRARAGRSRFCWSRTTTSMRCWPGACSRRTGAR